MMRLNRCSSMRIIPEGSQEEQKIRQDWDLRRTLSDFIKTTYDPPRYKHSNSILAELQQARDTDEETEGSEDDTEVEEEEDELDTPKINIAGNTSNTGIRIVGYLLKDGTYIKSIGDVFKPRPSLASITEVPFSFGFPSSPQKEECKNNKKSDAENDKGDIFNLYNSKCDKHDREAYMNELIKNDTDNLKCIGRTNSVDDSQVLENNNSFNKSKKESLSLQNLTVTDNDMDIFQNSPGEKINKRHSKVQDRIAKIEHRLSVSSSSPDEEEKDFVKIFSQEEITKRINKTDVNCTNTISKDKECKSDAEKPVIKKTSLLRESTRQMLSFISDVQADNEMSKFGIKSETERDEGPRRISF